MRQALNSYLVEASGQKAPSPSRTPTWTLKSQKVNIDCSVLVLGIESSKEEGAMRNSFEDFDSFA